LHHELELLQLLNDWRNIAERTKARSDGSTVGGDLDRVRFA
jgi:hypothetical protein